nr:alkylated DNA repair [Marseillevirus cajuinensis]
MEPPIFYSERFLCGSRKKLQRHLEDIEYLPPEVTAIKIHGKVVPIPRLQTGFGASEKLSYSFTGVKIPAKIWPPFLEKLALRLHRHLVENSVLEEGAPPPNYVLVNKYVDGEHHIGWHSDKETDLMEGYPIVSVSLGARRDFCLRLVNNHKHKKTISLGNGDVLVMLPGMQKVWQHCLPKRKNVVEPRYNLTFRWIGE